MELSRCSCLLVKARLLCRAHLLNSGLSSPVRRRKKADLKPFLNFYLLTVCIKLNSALQKGSAWVPVVAFHLSKGNTELKSSPSGCAVSSVVPHLTFLPYRSTCSSSPRKQQLRSSSLTILAVYVWNAISVLSYFFAWQMGNIVYLAQTGFLYL